MSALSSFRIMVWFSICEVNTPQTSKVKVHVETNFLRPESFFFYPELLIETIRNKNIKIVVLNY